MRKGKANAKNPKVVSLFSGAMGLDLGLEKAGFDPAVCVEIEPSAIKTIKHNRPSLPVFEDSIEKATGKALRKLGGFSAREPIDLVAGGPPCQAFSVFGNRMGIEDARGQLVFEFIRIVDELRPKTFLMENVRGLHSMSVLPKKNEKLTQDPELYEKGSLLRKILEGFNQIGYTVDCFLVNSVNYGAPQIRERLLLVGNRSGKRIDFPSPTHSNREEDGLPQFKTLGAAIGPDSGFEDPDDDVMNFSPRKLHYLSMVPEGGNWRSLPVEIQKESMKKSWYLKGGRSAYWRKLSFKFPSPTVVTMPNHAGTSMCHPTELRAISVGEAAAIQEFPRDWEFVGSATCKMRQIGNAVPTRLGCVAGKTIMEFLKGLPKSNRGRPNPLESRIIHLRPHVRTRSFWKNGKSLAGDHCYYSKDEQEKDLQLELKFEDESG